jgi:hypothetical protein
MVTKLRETAAVALLVIVSGGMFVAASNVDKALGEADGRRKAAENGLREIKTKSKEQAEQVRPLYAEAASRNNAWLGTVCQAIQQGKGPDVAAIIESAASALVQWVSARNRALGVAELTPPIAEAVKKRVVADLTEISAETWKDNRGASDQKRLKNAAALKDRLQSGPGRRSSRCAAAL